LQNVSTLSLQPRWRKYLQSSIEWAIIIIVAWLYCNATLLNFDSTSLQESGEHNESSTFPILTEVALTRYGQMPLWNAYAMTGLPYLQDPLNHFWNPISTIPVLIWGGINGMKVSIFLSFVLAGLGQWLFAHAFGVRGLSRLWAALLFLLSGGLAYFWAYGWYELVLGAVWFPWCFAALWWALRRRDWTSIVLTAICIGMVISTGGGYYPFYLFGSLGTLVIANFFMSGPSKRWGRLLRAVAVALISAAFLAVVILPIAQGLPLLNRWTGDDHEQTYSQPVDYTLMNFAISDRKWEGIEFLGLPSGWKWFYLSSIALGAALCLAPMALVSNRWRRAPLIAVGALTLVIIAWSANRFTPIGLIYQAFPFLYNLRFPNRLLVIAASPLLIVASIGWQNTFKLLKQRWHHNPLPAWSAKSKIKKLMAQSISLRWLPALLILAAMTYAVIDVYNVNQAFAFSNGSTDQTLQQALTWLKAHDGSLYYINLGGDSIYWHGTSVSYQMEIPVINFDYGRHLVSLDSQIQPEAPFIASPKYVIAVSDAPLTILPPDAQIIHSVDQYNIWYVPDALPVAFSAPPVLTQSHFTDKKLPREAAEALPVKYDGPNRVIAVGKPARPGDQLVVLVSDYPGWELLIDGQPTPMLPANGYLGAMMLPGNHTYTFNFRPWPYTVGLTISALTLLGMLVLMIKELPIWRKRKPAQASE
jgi:hypothetical protein